MANVICLLIGLLVGFYGQAVYSMLREILLRLQDTREYNKAGIVRPEVKQVQQIDLTSPTGGVRAPSPDQYVLANMKARDEKLKRM